MPRRGDKRSLLELATRNAPVAYESRSRETRPAHDEALETLRLVLQLPATPRRIDCFDISTFQGSETVASMVVCEDGRMQRREYRKFRIRPGEDAPLPDGVTAQARAEAPAGNPAAAARILDDFASMRQVVRRRYRAVAERGGPLPDLIVIDGGKGQLAAAYEALRSSGSTAPSPSASPSRKNWSSRATRPTPSPSRRAARRCGCCSGSATRRIASPSPSTARPGRRRDLRSELDDIAGVGPRRRNTLLKRFGSVAGVRRATREELTAVVGAQGRRRHPGALRALAGPSCGGRGGTLDCGAHVRHAIQDTVLVRINALRRHARTIEGAVVREPSKTEARNVLDTLGEAEAWLRGQPSPEVVAHIARMVADASRRLIALGGDVR